MVLVFAEAQRFRNMKKNYFFLSVGLFLSNEMLHFRVQNLLENSLMRSIMANRMQHNEYVSPLLYDKETP